MRRRVRIALAAVLLTLAGSSVVTQHVLTAWTSDTIAIINTDSGPVGSRIVEALNRNGAYVAAERTGASASVAAEIVLPADLSNAVFKIFTDQPQRVQVTVHKSRFADSSMVGNAIDQVTDLIRVEGVRVALANVSAARDLIGQASLTTRVLRAGVDDAVETAEHFWHDADAMLNSLETAKNHAYQMQTQISQLNRLTDQLAPQIDALARALDHTGVTIGDAMLVTSHVRDGLGDVLPALRSLPFASDPRMADIITKLAGLRELAASTGDQLHGFGELTESSVEADTLLSSLLRAGMSRLTSARAELNTSAHFAQQVPDLIDQGKTQLQDVRVEFTDGLGQMQKVLGSLDRITGRATAALPSDAQETQAIAAVIQDPVEVVQE